MPRVELQTFFARVNQRIKLGIGKGLHETAALIKTNSQRSLKRRANASPPGSPPHHHASGNGGLRVIRFDVSGDVAIIGPKKFAWSNFFNQPLTRVQEIGGIYRSKFLGLVKYPTRSYMYKPTQQLAETGLIAKKFALNIGRQL